jgi:DNA polymerase
LRIGVDHGKPQTVDLDIGQKHLSVTIVPLYHPAAALYNGSLRQTLLDDFTIVKKIINP